MAATIAPSAESLRFIALIGQGGSLALESGQISYLATMLDVSVDLIENGGKPSVTALGQAWLKLQLATPELLKNPTGGQQILQCQADAAEFALAVGSLGWSIATAPAMGPLGVRQVAFSAAGLMFQTLSTSVSCGNAAVAISGAAIRGIESSFRAATKVTGALLRNSIHQLNRITAQHFNPDNHPFHRLPTHSQSQFREFFNAIRVCLFFDGCSLALLLRHRVTASMANEIATGIIYAFENEFRRPSMHSTTALNRQEVTALASQYAGDNLCEAFGRLLQQFNMD